MPGEHPTPPQQPAPSHPHPVHPVRDRDHEFEVKGLRVALGSILSPKRYPSSRASASSSGTASPATSGHFGSGLVHPYPHHYGHGHGHTYPHGHGHNNYAPHEPSHLHTPEPESASADQNTGTLNAVTASGDDVCQEGARPTGNMIRTMSSSSATEEDQNGHLSQQQQQLPTPPSEPVILTTSNVHSLTPAQAQQVLKEKEKKGPGYIATLQSKRAWDALVHGSMS